MLSIGIDPGVTGAVGWVDSAGHAGVRDIPCRDVPNATRHRREIDPSALRMLIELVLAESRAATDTLFVVEAVAHMPNARLAPSGLASLMQSKGVVMGVLTNWPHTVAMVSPRMWKLDMHLRDDKGASLRMAREMYPGLDHLLARVADHNRAEALLIAAWGLHCMGRA